MTTIQKVCARQILDSRGNPTVECKVVLSCGTEGVASVPSGASTGENEAVELRDGAEAKNGKKAPFGGMGVLRAVENANTKIAKAVAGLDVFNQREIDGAMIDADGTPDKSKLGANAILAVSLAAARAAANALGVPLFRYLGGVNACVMPVPMMNIINGGAHSDAPVDIQEFMIVPSGVKSFAEAVRAGAEIFHALKGILKASGLSTSVGDEGGFAPKISSEEEALELIAKACEKSGWEFGKDVFAALDVASSEFFDKKRNVYTFPKSKIGEKSSDEMVEYLEKLADKFPICSIEDGCAECDWDGWKTLTKRFGGRLKLVGDDLFVTNVKYIKKGVKKGVANAVLIKPNQIGTLSETLEAIRLARNAGYDAIVSHRSGETADTFIADIAVGTNAGFIKTGSMSRGERTAKYNRLLGIESLLGKGCAYGLQKI